MELATEIEAGNDPRMHIPVFNELLHPRVLSTYQVSYLIGRIPVTTPFTMQGALENTVYTPSGTVNTPRVLLQHPEKRYTKWGALTASPY